MSCTARQQLWLYIRMVRIALQLGCDRLEDCYLRYLSFLIGDWP
jgi:hypothetical protein